MIIRDDFCSFWLKTFVVTPHLNRLVDKRLKTFEGSQQMFLTRINKNYTRLSPNTPSYLEQGVLYASVFLCYVLRENNFCDFLFTSLDKEALFYMRSTLKGKNLLLEEHILSFKN